MDSSAPQMQEAEGCPVAHGDERAVLKASSLTDAKILAHPNAYYSAMRHEEPVHFDEKLGMWLRPRATISALGPITYQRPLPAVSKTRYEYLAIGRSLLSGGHWTPKTRWRTAITMNTRS